MGKIIALIVALTLIPTCKTSAKEYSVKFQTIATTGAKRFVSDGTNQTNEPVPLSDGLVDKGWQCMLTPRERLSDNEVGQAVNCLNNKTGAVVSTFAHCNLYKTSLATSFLQLDDRDPAVVATSIVVGCTTLSVDRI